MKVHAFYHPADRLRVTIDDQRSYLTVKPVWSAPYRFPNQYLALLDGADKEIALIPDPATLDSASLAAVREELRRRYLTATITEIIEAKMVFGSTYWTVETDRGRREFVAQSLQENAVWLGPHHLLLLDVDSNRFEIPDTRSLGETSQRKLRAIV